MKEEKQQMLISKMMRTWESDWRVAKPFLDKRQNYYLAYQRNRDANSHPYKYNVVSPLVWSITENVAATFFNAYFSNERVTAIAPSDRNKGALDGIDDVKLARQLETALNRLQLHPEREYRDNMYDIFTEYALYGNAYSMDVPVFDEEGKYLGPETRHISVFDLIPDRRSYKMSNTEHVWHIERNVSKEELMSRMENEHGYLKMKEEEIEQLFNNNGWLERDYRDELLKELGLTTAKDLGGIDTKNGVITLIHQFNTRTGHYVTIAGNRVVVRDTTQPVNVPGGEGSDVKLSIPAFLYNPYDQIKLWPTPKEWYANGVGSVVTPYQRDIETLKSMRLENLDIAIHKVFMVNENLGIDVDDLAFFGGAIIPVADTERSIKVLDVGPETTRDAYLEAAEWQKEAQDASSSQEITRGNATQRREAATTVVALQEGAMKRVNAGLQRIKEWDARRTLNKLIQMRQYMRQEDYETLIGDTDVGFFQIPITRIAEAIDITPHSVSLSINRESDKNSLVQFAQMFGQFNVIKPNAFAELAMELWFPTKNPNNFIVTEEEQQQITQQQQEAQVAQGGGVTAAGAQPLSPEQLQEQAQTNEEIQSEQGV